MVGLQHDGRFRDHSVDPAFLTYSAHLHGSRCRVALGRGTTADDEVRPIPGIKWGTRPIDGHGHELFVSAEEVFESTQNYMQSGHKLTSSRANG